MGTIIYGDFEKVGIRVGKIISVEDFPEARKPAYKLQIGPFMSLGVTDENGDVLLSPIMEVPVGGKMF